MKYSTRKAIKENYQKIVVVGYCQLQHLLITETPTAYNGGVYGWNCDYYHIDSNTALCTGYRPHGNARIDYNILRQADTDALKRYYEDYTHRKITFEELKTINRNALADLCKMAH